MEELLILINENDEVIGFEEKMKTHINGKLHRAFSLFIFDKDRKKMLIHRRADKKYHSGGLWTNSCCSHPRKGEDLRSAVVRRTKQELGLDLLEKRINLNQMDSYEQGLHELGSFMYYKKFIKCAEYEIDHVFYLALHTNEITLDVNENEISKVMWISINELENWLKISPDSFTTWFPKAFQLVIEKVFLLKQ